MAVHRGRCRRRHRHYLVILIADHYHRHYSNIIIRRYYLFYYIKPEWRTVRFARGIWRRTMEDMKITVGRRGKTPPPSFRRHDDNDVTACTSTTGDGGNALEIGPSSCRPWRDGGGGPKVRREHVAHVVVDGGCGRAGIGRFIKQPGRRGFGAKCFSIYLGDCFSAVKQRIGHVVKSVVLGVSVSASKCNALS